MIFPIVAFLCVFYWSCSSFYWHYRCNKVETLLNSTYQELLDAHAELQKLEQPHKFGIFKIPEDAHVRFGEVQLPQSETQD